MQCKVYVRTQNVAKWGSIEDWAYSLTLGVDSSGFQMADVEEEWRQNMIESHAASVVVTIGIGQKLAVVLGVSNCVCCLLPCNLPQVANLVLHNHTLSPQGFVHGHMDCAPSSYI